MVNIIYEDDQIKEEPEDGTDQPMMSRCMIQYEDDIKKENDDVERNQPILCLNNKTLLTSKDSTSSRTSTMTVADIKVEPNDTSNDDDVMNPASTVETNLYADHEVKEEMVIGPTVLLKPNHHADQSQKSTDTSNKDDYSQKRPRSSKTKKKTAQQLCKTADVKQSRKTTDNRNKKSVEALICEYCQKVFDTRRKLYSHVYYTHKPADETCEICLKTFSHFKMKKHIKNMHSEKLVFPCDQCDKQYTSEHNLLRHKSTLHHKITCECGKQLIKRYYKKHRRAYCKIVNPSEINVITCNICQKKLLNEDRLKFHIKEAHDRKYYCDYCNLCVKAKKTLVGHIEKHHVPSKQTSDLKENMSKKKKKRHESSKIVLSYFFTVV